MATINTYRLKSSPNKILVIALRYLGDLLLTTPLIHSIRIAHPDAELHLMVHKATAPMLEGNPDIDHIIGITTKPDKPESRYIYKTIFRKYDLVFITETGDRRYLYALLAAPVRIAFTPPKKTKGWWKRFFVQAWVEYDTEDTHAVIALLNLARAIGIPPHYKLIPPSTKNSAVPDLPFPQKNYVVIHPHPQWNYKRWTPQGWIAVCKFLEAKRINIIFSGGPGEEEQNYIEKIRDHCIQGSQNISGKVTLAQLSNIIAQGLFFIGPDTGITHLAAATGVPVIAIYGPTNPVKWAPWPSGYKQHNNPFLAHGDQHVNNIHLIQGQRDCVPCQLEGCEQHRQSHSDCLDTLSSKRIIATINTILDIRDT